MAWPQTGYAPPPRARVSLRARVAGLAGVLLIVAGTAAVGVAIGAQVHMPHPSPGGSGDIRALPGPGHPAAARSCPWPFTYGHRRAFEAPASGVNFDGTIQVPSLTNRAGEAAWYKSSPTPGQAGTSVIESRR